MIVRRTSSLDPHLSEKLHDPLVLTEVLVALEEEHVVAPVLPLHRDLAGPLLGRDDLYKTATEDEDEGRELPGSCDG